MGNDGNHIRASVNLEVWQCIVALSPRRTILNLFLRPAYNTHYQVEASSSMGQSHCSYGQPPLYEKLPEAETLHESNKPLSLTFSFFLLLL
jgi:hypothetical protein